MRSVSVEILWLNYQCIHILENSVEEFHPHKTLSTPIKLLSFISSSIRCHISLFNTHETLLNDHDLGEHEGCFVDNL
jgi:hypothetical protein